MAFTFEMQDTKNVSRCCLIFPGVGLRVKITLAWEPFTIIEPMVIKVSSRLFFFFFSFCGLSMCAQSMEIKAYCASELNNSFFLACVVWGQVTWLLSLHSLVCLGRVSEPHTSKPLELFLERVRHVSNVSGSLLLLLLLLFLSLFLSTPFPKAWGEHKQKICAANSLVVCFQYFPSIEQIVRSCYYIQTLCELWRNRIA